MRKGIIITVTIQIILKDFVSYNLLWF
jgi:hypothetical protein